MDNEDLSNSYKSSITTSVIRKRIRTSSTNSLKSESMYEDSDDEFIDDIEVDELINEAPELFVDNLECVDKCDCLEIDIVDNDYTDYEIINESICIPIKNRYRKQTWYEYFRKLYMVTVILIISIVVYFYYSYGNRKDNITTKL
jgi:hypothetical protein